MSNVNIPQNPTFVVGYPCSGTTLLQALIAHEDCERHHHEAICSVKYEVLAKKPFDDLGDVCNFLQIELDLLAAISSMREPERLSDPQKSEKNSLPSDIKRTSD